MTNRGLERRICIFCEKWGTGGIESFLVNVLENMDRSGLSIDVVAAVVTSEFYFPRLRALHITVYELSGSTHLVFKNYILLRKMLLKNRYDVFHINAFIAISYFYLGAAKAAGIKKRIVHSHNTALRKSFLRPLKIAGHVVCKHVLYSLATDFWTCSQEAADFMFPEKLKSGSVKMVCNGIDVNRFVFSQVARDNARKALDVTDEWVIGNVGRLCEQKNQRFLLRILKCLLKKQKGAVLLLVGNGDMALIKKEAEKLEIDENVILYGPAEHVEQLLCAMDVFVFPSLFEGFGIAALEAQASGLPVLCSENVPAEMNITPLYHQLAIDEGVDKWADAVISAMEQTHGRENYTAEIRTSGYDIAKVAEWVGSEYSGR